MTVHYRGFMLTQDQAQRLLHHALDQLLGSLPMSLTGRPPRRVPTPKRRRQGRPPLTAAERKAASRRMKAMWKSRRAAGKTGRLESTQ